MPGGRRPPGRAGFRRLILVAVLGATAVVATGCDYLLYGSPLYPAPSLDPDASFDPNEFAKPLATYTSGRATLVIDGGQPIVLDRLRPGPHLYESYGAEVSWSNADGWYLKVASSTTPGYGDYTTVTLDRVADNQHWTVWDVYGRCKYDVTSGPDEQGLAGTADCSKLQWTDALATSTVTYEPVPVEGEAPFDVIVTFEAKR